MITSSSDWDRSRGRKRRHAFSGLEIKMEGVSAMLTEARGVTPELTKEKRCNSVSCYRREQHGSIR